jgi:hypothetical protein
MSQRSERQAVTHPNLGLKCAKDRNTFGTSQALFYDESHDSGSARGGEYF